MAVRAEAWQYNPQTGRLLDELKPATNSVVDNNGIRVNLALGFIHALHMARIFTVPPFPIVPGINEPGFFKKSHDIKNTREVEVSPGTTFADLAPHYYDLVELERGRIPPAVNRVGHLPWDLAGYLKPINLPVAQIRELWLLDAAVVSGAVTNPNYITKTDYLVTVEEDLRQRALHGNAKNNHNMEGGWPEQFLEGIQERRQQLLSHASSVTSDYESVWVRRLQQRLGNASRKIQQIIHEQPGVPIETTPQEFSFPIPRVKVPEPA